MTPEAIPPISTVPSRETGARAAAAPSAIPAAGGGSPPVQTPDDLERARAAADEVKRRLVEKDSELTIDFDESLGRAIFRLIDTTTGEVVRQIPSPEMLAIARALAAEAGSGVLLRTDA